MSIATTDHPVAPPFWAVPLAELHGQLGDRPDGLTAAVAQDRLATYGANTLRPKKPQALSVQFLRRFRNPLVIILLVANGISAATGDFVSFAIITAIILISVTLDFVQEYQAQQAAARLNESVAVRTQVWRDGQLQAMLPGCLVPGDLVALSAGDLVPADGRILSARDFFVNQALLTGESYPVEKMPGETVGGATDLTAATGAVFMGTAVLSGTATVLVCRTGPTTALGDIAAALAVPAPATAFETGTREFGLLIMRLTVLLVLFVILVNALSHKPFLESFLFAVALAVGLTPELLPMVVSVTLARGAMRMAKAKVIVKRLSAIHDLGSMDVLCTDKTGTLTAAQICLEAAVDGEGRPCPRVLTLAYLNSFFESGVRTPLDEALLASAATATEDWRKVDEVPFDFERRRVSVLLDGPDGRILVVKGAPEDVIGGCTHTESDPGVAAAALDGPARSRLLATFQALGTQGYRALGVAWRPVPADHAHAGKTDEAGLTFAGFVTFLDPPKPGAAAALAALAADGIAVKVVSGDNEAVCRHVCETLGLTITGVVTGPEVEALTDLALSARTEAANLFCRVTPPQKNRIIQALKRRGHVVGYLGDGINDAPALHTADVGISVDGAVADAKDAAALILLEPDLGVLHAGVREGRRTFGNIMKYIMMGTSSNFGNMFSMAGAALFLPFLPMLPLQILLNNLLYDFSQLAIPFDTVDEAFMAKPQAWNMSFIRSFMLTMGPVSSLFDFATFYLLIRVFHAGAGLFHTGWFIESLASQILVVFVIRTRQAAWRSRPSPFLTAGALICLVTAVALPLSGLGGHLGFVMPPALFFAALGGLVAAYLLLAEITKRLFYRHWPA
ncbi:MAG: magnesium-translocating P-type ATPase [Candidatus Sericytochromatia bacterium]|nr:magnesium-translocating P-type ATPase [Candidatus Sericytochromatia bacterium]